MIRRVSVALAVGLFAFVAFPLAAGAHVEIEADGSVAADGTVKATLVVPNECEGSETTSIDLNFPATPALTTVTEDAVSGFTAANTTSGATVTKVTWTGTVSGTEEKKLPLTLGPIPSGTEEVKFTALQNCANGDVIRWVEPTPPGGEEPEFPAPVLALTKSTAETPSTSKVEVTTKDSSDDSNTTAIVIAVIAGVVVIGGIAFAISRRKS